VLAVVVRIIKLRPLRWELGRRIGMVWSSKTALSNARYRSRPTSDGGGSSADGSGAVGSCRL
jgi:hypothetical protein